MVSTISKRTKRYIRQFESLFIEKRPGRRHFETTWAFCELRSLHFTPLPGALLSILALARHRQSGPLFMLSWDKKADLGLIEGAQGAFNWWPDWDGVLVANWRHGCGWDAQGCSVAGSASLLFLILRVLLKHFKCSHLFRPMKYLRSFWFFPVMHLSN